MYTILKIRIEPYHPIGIAAEWDMRKWKSFRQELDKSERKIFDEMKFIS
ncbi:MAG TPA: hypothetical protein VE548_08540 [Nitrososphaeraceae archaeon]|nr:hypothetical protein [Nitrososphaeraceae archaeon]